MERNIGEIFSWSSRDNRKFIKTIDGIEIYAVYVAKQNPEICGKWFEGCEVHHKDGNRLNDQPENLICLTPEEHHKIHRASKCRRVTAYLNGIKIGEFDSICEASRKTGVGTGVISKQLNDPPKKSNYSDWRFVDNT